MNLPDNPSKIARNCHQKLTENIGQMEMIKIRLNVLRKTFTNTYRNLYQIYLTQWLQAAPAAPMVWGGHPRGRPNGIPWGSLKGHLLRKG